MSESDAEPQGNPVQEEGFANLLETLSTTYGFDFREYKPASLVRRLQARMASVHADSLAGVRAGTSTEHPGEHVELFNTILINVTGFFRDPEAWRRWRRRHPRARRARPSDTRSIRVWSAGCSSGEEVFSMAMLLAEHLGDRAADLQVKIYGTDVDEEALAAARQACTGSISSRTFPRLLDRYFTREGQLYRFRRDLRRWCIFGAHNLTQAPPLSHIDLLLAATSSSTSPASAGARAARFHYALARAGSCSWAARSRSSRSRLFRPVHLKWRIFERTAGADPRCRRCRSSTRGRADRPRRARASESAASRSRRRWRRCPAQ